MVKLSDLRRGDTDGLGQAITRLFYRKPKHYAVYVADRRVMIGYPDDEAPEAADQQRRDMSELAPTRGQIDALIDGWQQGTDRSMWGVHQSSAVQAKADGYNRRIADALAVALEGDIGNAQGILGTIKQEILDERVARARFEYLIAAILTALGLMFASWLVTSTYRFTAPDTGWWHRVMSVALVTLLLGALAACAVFYSRWHGGRQTMPGRDPREVSERSTLQNQRDHFWSSLLPSAFLFLGVAILVAALLLNAHVIDAATSQYDGVYSEAVALWRAAAAGSIGAFFSIAIGIRRRTILPDLLRTSNEMDAALRVSIGFIGGAALVAFLKLDLVRVTLGSADFASSEKLGSSVLAVLALGFVAGFSERLVPDLLEKANAEPGSTQTRAGGSRSQSDAAAAAAAAAAAKVSDGEADDHEGEADLREEEASEDGCAADHEVTEEDATPDDQLPAAAGRVAPAAEERPQ